MWMMSFGLAAFLVRGMSMSWPEWSVVGSVLGLLFGLVVVWVVWQAKRAAEESKRFDAAANVYRAPAWANDTSAGRAAPRIRLEIEDFGSDAIAWKVTNPGPSSVLVEACGPANDGDHPMFNFPGFARLRLTPGGAAAGRVSAAELNEHDRARLSNATCAMARLGSGECVRASWPRVEAWTGKAEVGSQVAASER
jgi:hypothetical protein